MQTASYTYNVRVVREASADPIAGQVYDYAEQSFIIGAESPQLAHRLANRLCTLTFRGQIRRTFINGEEHFDESY